MAGKSVVVLGGGFGGARAAIAARRLLGPEHRVTLVDRNRMTHICGSFPFLIVGEREAGKTGRSLGRLANYGVEFVQAEVRKIDTASRRLVTGAGEVGYDFLVIAAGAEYDWSAVPGSAAAHSFYGLAQASRLRRSLARIEKGRVVIAVSALPYKCPPAPFEAAMLINWSLRRSGVRRNIEMQLFTPEPAPLGIAGPEATKRITEDMAKRGIGLRAGVAVKEVSPDGRTAHFNDGSHTDASLVITIPVHRIPAVIAESGLGGGKPWLPVSPETLETPVPGVFAIGDVNTVLMANGRPLPKAGVFAAGEGETAAAVIAARVSGGAPPPPYSGEGMCFLAYSGGTSGSLAGTFLGGPPAVRFNAATAAGMKGKERFERDWRRFRI